MRIQFPAIILCLLISSSVLSQAINEFDSNGKRHGVWKKKFKNTDVLRYEGEFFHGKEIGLFKFYKKRNNKAVLTATKQFNETDNISEVKFLTSRGKVISEGKMDGKTYIGTWKYYQQNSNELLTLEHFDNSGKLTGERFVYYKNGQIAEKQNYVDGKLHGVSLWYSDKNVLIKEFIYENGELHGISKFYDSYGVLVAEGLYKRGKKDGIWKYYEKGELIDEKDYTYIPKYIKKK